jgi:monofunctional biosynthetic peptidoglycan transglycosylase
MAKRAAKKTRRRSAKKTPGPVRRGLRWAGFGLIGLAGLVLLLIALFAVVNPPTTPYMVAEARRQGEVRQDWVALEDIAPVMARSVVAAEDANFCLHWGFDMAAIRAALDEGAERGASTISQQVVKNVFLWQGRSWPRKALESMITPVVELIWTKRRVIEVYLNVAEFGTGVFGVEAAAREAFGVSARDLTPAQAARLAAVLPAPKERSAAAPNDFVRRRAAQVADGAATIRADGRADCFEG